MAREYLDEYRTIENETLENGSKIINCKLHRTVKAYNNSIIKNSILGPDCTAGDNAHILNSELIESVRINRRSQVVNSKIDFASHTNHNTTVRDTDIGKYCSISWNVSIGGTDHNIKSASTFNPSWWKEFFGDSENIRTFDHPKCKIGNDVWIASGANILRKVKVGDGAVIGAGAVVTKDVPPYAIVVGVPGKIVGYRFDDEVVQKLLKIEWWNWPKEVIKENISLLQADITPDILDKMEKISKNM